MNKTILDICTDADPIGVPEAMKIVVVLQTDSNYSQEARNTINHLRRTKTWTKDARDLVYNAIQSKEDVKQENQVRIDKEISNEEKRLDRLGVPKKMRPFYPMDDRQWAGPFPTSKEHAQELLQKAKELDIPLCLMYGSELFGMATQTKKSETEAEKDCSNANTNVPQPIPQVDKSEPKQVDDLTSIDPVKNPVGYLIQTTPFTSLGSKRWVVDPDQPW